MHRSYLNLMVKIAACSFFVSFALCLYEYLALRSCFAVFVKDIVVLHVNFLFIGKIHRFCVANLALCDALHEGLFAISSLELQIYQLLPSTSPKESQLSPHISLFTHLFGFFRRFVITSIFSVISFRVKAPADQGLAKNTVRVVWQCVYSRQIAFFFIFPTR